jgi:uncharacterized protein involved in outer membrane biogenesis
MRRLAKIVGGIIVVVVVLIVAAVVYVTTIDPASLVAAVQAQVKAATGRDLAVRGGARIALSLHPRIVLTDVALSNAPWASTQDMVKAQRIELALALVPLLSRRFELEEIRLVSPQISLETSKAGEKNWEMRPAAGAASPGGGGSNLAAAVAISDFEIDNGIVTYRDAASAGVTGLNIEKLSLREKALGSDMRVEFRGSVGDVAIAVTGQLGSFESLLAQSSPYSIDLGGEVEGVKFAVTTKVKAQAQRYTLDDLKLVLGANAVNGTFALDASGARPKLVFDVEAPTLALSAVPVPAVPAAASTAPAAPKSGRNYLIPDTPVSFAPLRWIDAEGKLAIGKLLAASGRQYDNVRMQFALHDGRLDLRNFSLGAFGGVLTGSIVVDASRADATALSVNVDGKGLSLGALLAAAGQPREVRGGKSELAADLAMRGNSPHAWAASATGNVRLVSGPATLVNSKLAAASWDKLNDAINPFRTRDPATELVCAVVRFPINNGIAKVDHSIAMETSKLGVTASGTLDFRNETLDFTFQPKVKKGISIDFAGFSDLVHVTGPFSSPQLAMNVAGSAKVIASVGAAISTGGLSAVAQGLFSWAEGNGPGPCQVALGAAAAPASAQKQNSREVPAGNDLGKALNKLFGK